MIIQTPNPYPVTISGTPVISGTVTANQGGTWNINALTSITNPVAVTQSGTWSTGRTWTLDQSTDSVAANLTRLNGTAVSVNSNIADNGTLRVTLATDINAPFDMKKIMGQNVDTGPGAAGPGTQRVAIASNSTIGTVTSVTSVTAVTSIGTLSTLTSITNPVAVTQSGSWSTGRTWTLSAGSDNTTITPPTLTKGTQGSTGLSTQDLKDAGRTHKRFYATNAAAGTSTTETAITLTLSSQDSATTTGTSFVITNNKTLRITAIIFATRCATPATSLAYDRYSLEIPDGIEIYGDGSKQIGLTAAATYTTNAPTWDATIIAYEY